MYIDGDDDRYICIDIIISCMYSIYSFMQSSSLSFLAVMITQIIQYSYIYISVSSFIIITNTTIIIIDTMIDGHDKGGGRFIK